MSGKIKSSSHFLLQEGSEVGRNELWSTPDTDKPAMGEARSSSRSSSITGPSQPSDSDDESSVFSRFAILAFGLALIGSLLFSSFSLLGEISAVLVLISAVDSFKKTILHDYF